MPTRRNNDTIPSLDAFFESKASEARRRAAEHIGKQKEPNVPILPKAFGENPFKICQLFIKQLLYFCKQFAEIKFSCSNFKNSWQKS